MILQALVKHYEDLVSLGKLPREGWSQQKISYALEIDGDGQLLWVTCIRQPEQRGKKEAMVPQLLELPMAVKRSAGIIPNFLWDNSSYMLGIDNKGNPVRAANCYEAARELHKRVLSDVVSPAAQALLRFFDNWSSETAAKHPELQENVDDIISGANLVFRYDGAYIHEDADVCRAWQTYKSANASGDMIRCIVTGQEAELARLHPSIKGIPGAQSSGASLVSYNAPAFCSYQKEQGQNAPTGEYAAFAYGAALNYLIAESKQHPFMIGDTTVLCWAEGAEPEYSVFFDLCMNGNQNAYQQEDIAEILKALIQGRTANYDETLLDPEKPFYVLGISPNAARLSVRFFMRNSFGGMLKNVAEHQKRLSIVKPSFERFDQISLWAMLNETVNQNARTKVPASGMAGEVLRAVLNNTMYPATLLNGVVLRIRADHEINRNRAAIIKAYYLKNPHSEFPNPEEVFTVSLNPESSSIPYQLGRLFAVLEEIQDAANPGINTTIKDKYFNSASATPATIFPVLENLSQKHLRKKTPENRMWLNKLDKMKQEIMAHLDERYPIRLSLPEQGAFQIGYYHQKQARYAGKNTEE